MPYTKFWVRSVPGLEVFQRQRARVARLDLLEYHKQGLEPCHQLVVETNDKFTNLDQPVDRTTGDNAVEAHTTLHDRIDPKVIKRSDDRRVLRGCHQLQVAFALLICGTGAEHLLLRAKYDLVFSDRSHPIADCHLTVDGNRGEEDLALGLKEYEAIDDNLIVRRPSRSWLQRNCAVVDDRVTGKNPAHPLGRHHEISRA